MEADLTPATSEEESEEEYVVAGHILATTECAEVRLGAANPAVGLEVGPQGDQQFLDRGGCLVPHAGHLHLDQADPQLRLDQVEQLVTQHQVGQYRGRCSLTAAEAFAAAEFGEAAVAAEAAGGVVAEVVVETR